MEPLDILIWIIIGILSLGILVSVVAIAVFLINQVLVRRERKKSAATQQAILNSLKPESP